MQIIACTLQVFRVNHKELKRFILETSKKLEVSHSETKLRYCPTVIYGLWGEQTGNKCP